MTGKRKGRSSDQTDIYRHHWVQWARQAAGYGEETPEQTLARLKRAGKVGRQEYLRLKRPTKRLRRKAR